VYIHFTANSAARRQFTAEEAISMRYINSVAIAVSAKEENLISDFKKSKFVIIYDILSLMYDYYQLYLTKISKKPLDKFQLFLKNKEYQVYLR
jgi:hypothetical protein